MIIIIYCDEFTTYETKLFTFINIIGYFECFFLSRWIGFFSLPYDKKGAMHFQLVWYESHYTVQS